ncbi:MAG: 3D domain-containing protein [Bacillota bacterium]|nr:3D domain-containing protein [Bacillota bacterium]
MFIVVTLIAISPREVIAPILPKSMALDLVKSNRPVVVSRSLPKPRVEKRVMRVTAYSPIDKGMNGLKITASGEKAVEGRTVAADMKYSFGTQIYIPVLEKNLVITDRGGAIKGDRLDLYFDSRRDAIAFGVQYLEVFIKK